jgi:hypothetical protein
MHVITDAVRSAISLDDAFIAIYILTVIAAAEGAILLNLAEKVGGVRKLLRLASRAIKKEVNNTSDKKTNS